MAFTQKVTDICNGENFFILLVEHWNFTCNIHKKGFSILQAFGLLASFTLSPW